MSAVSIVDQAFATAEGVHAIRRRLRKRVPRSPERDREILPVLDEIDAAMRPLRSLIGRFQFESFGALERKATDISAQLQYERRQLKKMLHGPRDA